MRNFKALPLFIIFFTFSAFAQNGGRIAGRIVFAGDASPVAGATVQIVQLGRTTIADDQGKYEFTNIPAGRYTIAAHRDGFGDVARSIVIAGGVTQDRSEGFEIGVKVADYEIAHGGFGLSLSEPQEGDLRRRADTGRDADGSDTSRNVGRGVSLAIETINVGCKESGGVDGLIQNLDSDLSAVCVSRKQQIIPLPGRYRKDVGIVLQQQVGGAGNDEALGAAQIPAPLPLRLEILSC